MLRPLAVFALVVLVAPASLRASEGGTTHYAPGATASFIDAIPPEPGAALLAFGVYYSGDTSKNFPVAGLNATLDARCFVENFFLFYEPEWKPLGLTYAAAIGIPFMTLKAKGTITGPLGNTFVRTDYATGLGDMLLIPAYFGYKTGDWTWMGSLSVFAPTGEFERGELANTGLNYWTFMPEVAVSYLSPKNGRELDIYTGFDFNTRNPKTEYQSGVNYHIDVTAAQHLPFGFGIGANAFLIQQVGVDSGAGATQGNFQGRTVGIGPVLSYIKQWEGKTLAIEAKWLPELETDHRLNGDWIWLKAAFSF
jgi:hypothetical protein